MYVAIRDALLNLWGAPGPFDALEEIGLNAVEVEVDRSLAMPGLGFNQSLYDESASAALAQTLSERNVRIAALLMHNDFAGEVDREVEWAVAAAELAARLSIPAIRVDLVPHKPMATDDFLTRAITGMKKIIELSPSSVKFAVENHGGVTNDRNVLEKLFNGIDSPNFGVTMDTGNFYWFGLPLSEVYDLLTWIAPKAYHTHLKNIKYPEDLKNTRRPMGLEYEKYCCPLAEGDIDHGKVVNILRNAGYQGPLTIEDECIWQRPVAERLAVVKDDVQHVAGLIV